MGAGARTVPLGLDATGMPHVCTHMSGNDAALQVLLVPSLNSQQNLWQLGTKGQTAWWSSFPVSLSVSRDKPGARPSGVGGQGVLEPLGAGTPSEPTLSSPGHGNDAQQPFLRTG